MVVVNCEVGNARSGDEETRLNSISQKGRSVESRFIVTRPPHPPTPFYYETFGEGHRMMNIGETPAVQVPKEFLAVILAGVGDEYVQPSGNSIHIQFTF